MWLSKLTSWCQMQPTFKIIKEDRDVDARLAELFATTREELYQIVRAVVGARNSVVLNDPITAAGQVAYQLGTRAVRDLFLPKGWARDRVDNIETAYHADTRQKIIYQNVDSAADPLRDPKAISGKGPAMERMVALTMPSLFPEWDAERLAKQNASAWFFCVSVNGDDVRAELSRPLSIEGGQFALFVERIFIVKSGEWRKFDPSKFEDDSVGNQTFEINVTRK